MPIKSEAEFIAWVESVEAWIKNHIERHHNSTASHEDHLPVVTPTPPVAVVPPTDPVEHPAA